MEKNTNNIPNDLIILVCADLHSSKKEKEMSKAFLDKSSAFRIVSSNEMERCFSREETIYDVIRRQQWRNIPSVLFVSNSMEEKGIKGNNVYILDFNKSDVEFYTLKNKQCGLETKGRSITGLVGFTFDEIVEQCDRNKIAEEVLGR